MLAGDLDRFAKATFRRGGLLGTFHQKQITFEPVVVWLVELGAGGLRKGHSFRDELEALLDAARFEQTLEKLRRKVCNPCRHANLIKLI